MNPSTPRTPLAYFLSFRTYATWLHGDARGSVDRQHNGYGEPLLAPSAALAGYQRTLLRQPPVYLDDAQRARTAQSIRAVCEHRAWTIHGLAVQATHVHVVVSANGRPESAVRDLKSWATRSLRGSGLWNSELSPWSSGASTRYVWSRPVLAVVCAYVAEGHVLPSPWPPAG